MIALFYDMMHEEMIVYVDDLVAKSTNEEDRPVDLKKIFEGRKSMISNVILVNVCSMRLLANYWALNSASSELKSPSKIKTIIEIPAPRME